MSCVVRIPELAWFGDDLLGLWILPEAFEVFEACAANVVTVMQNNGGTGRKTSVRQMRSVQVPKSLF